MHRGLLHTRIDCQLKSIEKHSRVTAVNNSSCILKIARRDVLARYADDPNMVLAHCVCIGKKHEEMVGIAFIVLGLN